MKFREAAILLTHQEPLTCEALVVRLSKCLDEDTYGTCDHDIKRNMITIRVNKSLPLVAQLDALMHEWAHAMLVDTQEEFDKHGDSLVWLD